MGLSSATARVARAVVGVLLAAGCAAVLPRIAPSAALATKDEFETPGNSTDRRRLQPGSSGPNCPAGMFDMTEGNWHWWQCGHGCAGGRYTDTQCHCACQCESGNPAYLIGSDGPCVDSDYYYYDNGQDDDWYYYYDDDGQDEEDAVEDDDWYYYDDASVSVMDDSSIRDAVAAWLADATAAEAMYGHISTWETSEVTDMSYLFCAQYCSYSNSAAAFFNEDISAWDTSGVTTMEGMFIEALSFNRDIGAWDTSGVISMYGVFGGALAFNQDIGDWAIDSVTTMFWSSTAPQPSTRTSAGAWTTT